MPEPECVFPEKMSILFLQTSRVVNKYYNTLLNNKLRLSISKIASVIIEGKSSWVEVDLSRIQVFHVEYLA